MNMVLERIISVKKAETNPYYAGFFGIIITLIAILVGYRVFEINAGMATLAFIVIGSLPFLRKLISIEESKEATANTFKQAFSRNRKIIEIFFYFFLGVSAVYFSLSMIFPNLGELLFTEQHKVFSGSINYSLENSDLLPILKNNFSIIILALVLSLLYGAGAIFIISWNASVLGTFLAYKGIPKMFTYLPHASIEFVAFFMAAIAGSIISEAIEKEDYRGTRFRNILRDAGLLVVLSAVMIVVAAIVEIQVI